MMKNNNVATLIAGLLMSNVGITAVQANEHNVYDGTSIIFDEHLYDTNRDANVDDVSHHSSGSSYDGSSSILFDEHRYDANNLSRENNTNHHGGINTHNRMKVDVTDRFTANIGFQLGF